MSRGNKTSASLLLGKVKTRGGVLMPQLQHTIQTEHLIERYPCPKCDWYMMRTESRCGSTHASVTVSGNWSTLRMRVAAH
jgi:hypothetical protein